MDGVQEARRRVVVVGAGVAGAFAAYFLRQALGPAAEIVVRERQARPGGRVGEMELAGRRVETGATLVHSSNRYLLEATARLGLHPGDAGGERRSLARRMGIWNGVSFDLLVRMAGLPLALAMLRRYGASLLRARRLTRAAVARLLRLYDELERGRGFSTPGEMYRELGLDGLARESAYDFLARHGVGERFVREFSDGVARSNYGQDGRMNAWATLVSLTGGGLAGGRLFSVREGNLRVVEGLLSLSGARLQTNATVRAIRPRATPEGGRAGFAVASADGSEEACDAVILAAPLELAELDFDGLALPGSASLRRPYQTTHATWVVGRLRGERFGLAEQEAPPDVILTRERREIPFSAIGALAAAAGGRRIYKLFSREPLDEALLDHLFADRVEAVRLTWNAYPVLSPAEVWPPFRLAPGLYYANAMESAVSTMETEAMAARNVVNLLVQDLAGDGRG
ncbi:MAG: FAD-dependent oxidoreductase [Bacillota bacterium]|nr:FAD-dependent oxidoreductase [Bacillota bacterium]